MEVKKIKILANTKIAKDTYRMELSYDNAKMMRPGQFINIKIDGFMLRRPISISEVISRTSFAIVYKVVGDGTAALSEMKEGQMIDMLGPLGSFYPVHEDIDEVIIIGGGVGVPPLLELAKKYRKIRRTVHVVLGFNDSESVFYEDEFRKLGADVTVATMDGSYGVKGTVMDAIREKEIEGDFVCCCGPVPMLKAVEEKYSKGYMSFESRMACGMGACMACVARDKKEENMYHRICKEGPVFPIGKVEY